MKPGFYPFWFWNAEIEESELRRQIREMAAHGIRGFYVHSRQGLRTPYLSEAFFHAVSAAIDEAEGLGLSVHLYDEYPYPSGVAGGELILGNPEYAATELSSVVYESRAGAFRAELPPGRVLRCVAYPIGDEAIPLWDDEFDVTASVGMVLARDTYNETGLTTYNRKRYFASNPTPTLDVVLPVTADRWRVFAVVQCVVTEHKYWSGFVDCLNPEATERFIELTHERYRTRYGDLFGKVILSVFSDETAPSWSTRIPPRFRETYGYDIVSELPTLLQDGHPRCRAVRRDFERLRYRMFLESFEEPIRKWCRENRILYTGEKPAYRVSQLSQMDIPGCDPGHTKAGRKSDALKAAIRSNARAVASAAYVYRKPGALCECYHSMGWGATLQDARLVADTLILFGINYLVPHGFFYSTHGLRKHDAPPSFFFQMPYWRLWRLVSERVERIMSVFARTHMDAKVLVIDPSPYQPDDADQEEYERILDYLMAIHRGFLTVDFDVLKDAAGTRGVDGVVRIRELECRAVVMPPVGLLDDEVSEWLDRFETCGGTVVRGNSAGTDLALLERTIAPSVPIEILRGDSERVYSVSRSVDDRRVYYIVNTSEQPAQVGFTTRDRLAEIPLDPGMPDLLSVTDAGYERALGPFESLLVSVMPSKGRASVRTPRIERITLPAPDRMRLLSANVARLGSWEMTVAGDSFESCPPRIVAPSPIANQLGQASTAFAPAFRFRFGLEPVVSVPPLTVHYSCEFQCAYDGAVVLVAEPDSLVGSWSITVNNGKALVDRDFVEAEDGVYPVPGARATDISGQLLRGRNTVHVTIVCSESSEGLVNPLYLSGGFGVLTAPLRIVEPVSEAAFNRYGQNRIPYYSGTIEYEFGLELSDEPTMRVDAYELEFGVDFEDSCEVSFNNGPFHPAPWSPYRVAPDAGEVSAGVNKVVLRTHSSLIRTFEGTRFAADRHAYIPVEDSGRQATPT